MLTGRELSWATRVKTTMMLHISKICLWFVVPLIRSFKHFNLYLVSEPNNESPLNADAASKWNKDGMFKT